MGGIGSGRRATPKGLKELRGNPGHRKLNELEPDAQCGEPKMPELSAIAAGEWRAIVPILLKMHVLTEADGKALAAYCTAFEQWMLANKAIEKHGLLIKGAYGEPKPNPAVRIRSDALKLMKSFLVEFGLTPASRSRLKVSDGQPQDPLDAFLNRKAASAVPQ